MAKTIKFNLICDGNPVRSIDDLRENFAIEDILNYYESELLHRWLNVRDYHEILGKVENISSTDSLEIIKELINIFEIETDLNVIEKNTYILQYQKENKILLEEYKQMNYRTSAIIDDYYARYVSIVDSIIENHEDMAKIKAFINELEKSYFRLFEYNYRELFYKLLDNAPMGIFAILMNEKLRYFYLPRPQKPVNWVVSENITQETEQKYESMSEDKEAIFAQITTLVSDTNKLKDVLKDNLKIFAGRTEDYWKDIEAKGKKYMILSIEDDNYVRPAGVVGGDMELKDINNKFVIIDGIDYKSKFEYDELLYLEV